VFKYLAVIKDSFREALASRVLWILLGLITLLLAALAPLGYGEVLTWRLGENEVRGWESLMDQVRKAGQRSTRSPARRIWDLLDPQLRERLAQVKIPGIDPDTTNPWEFVGVYNAFRKSLNELLEQREFYEEAAFRSVPLLSQELRDLREEGLDKLRDPEVARFNRLLLEAAFPDHVRGSPPTSIQLHYAWWEFGEPFPLRGADLRELLQGTASFVMTWFVGAMGMIVAILVTAPIVPQMFDPGSLHLLLSKPVSRWLLFLAKFLGGCAFILICATYLVTGLWLILGSRFGVWDSKLLLGIPIYLFVFAIYYAVSALVGVVYRSPIVCVALTVVFWGVCFMVGLAKVSLESTIWASARITRVLQAGDDLLAVNELGSVHQWDATKREWREIFTSQDGQARAMMIAVPEIRSSLAPLGPVYDAAHDRLISVQPRFPPTGNPKLVAANRSDDWEPVSHHSAPSGTRGVFQEPHGGVLIVSSLGLFRLTGDPFAEEKPMELPFGIKLPLPSAGPLENVGPRDKEAVLLTDPATAALNQTTGELAVYTRGTLTLLQLNADQRYERVAEHRLDGKERQPIVLGFGGSSLVLGREDGRLQVLDSKTFAERLSTNPEGPHQVRFINASPDGRWFAALFHNGALWLYDAQTNAVVKARVSGLGGISSAMFAPEGDLLVADLAVRLTAYRLPDFHRQRRFAPRMGLLLRSYRYGILPLYTIFPKPGELDTTFNYFLSGKETQERPGANENLAAAQRRVNPWTPVWSSALFMLVMLVAACVYIEWQEF